MKFITKLNYNKLRSANAKFGILKWQSNETKSDFKTKGSLFSNKKYQRKNVPSPNLFAVSVSALLDDDFLLDDGLATITFVDKKKRGSECCQI